MYLAPSFSIRNQTSMKKGLCRLERRSRLLRSGNKLQPLSFSSDRTRKVSRVFFTVIPRRILPPELQNTH